MRTRVPPYIIRTGSMEEVLMMEKLIPEFDQETTSSEFISKTAAVKSLILVACQQNTAIGYKVGYQQTPEVFYSWIGGIVPEFRGQGIGQALLDYQEKWARSAGFRFISVKSGSSFTAMINLLARNNYQVIQHFPAELPSLKKTLFQKSL